MFGSRLLLVPAVLAALLLAGCSAAPDGELETELAQLAGVEQVDVDSTRVKATLAADIAAAEAQTVIGQVRDLAVEQHPLGADVELVVVLPAGPRDFGGAQPWEVYSYGRWSTGAVADEAFAQQAAFVASLADWETLLTTPAQVLRVEFTAAEVVADPEAEGAEEGGVEGEATPAPTEGAAVVPQILDLTLDQPYPTENSPTDIAALITELGALWVASGGVLEAIVIS